MKPKIVTFACVAVLILVALWVWLRFGSGSPNEAAHAQPAVSIPESSSTSGDLPENGDKGTEVAPPKGPSLDGQLTDEELSGVLAKIWGISGGALGANHPLVKGHVKQLESVSMDRLFEAVNAITDAKQRQMLARCLAVIAAKRDPEKFFTFIRESFTGETQTDLSRFMVRSWVNENAEDAADWFVKHELDESLLLGGAEERDALAEVVTKGLATAGNIDKAIELWGNLTGRERQRSALKGILSRVEPADLPALTDRIVSSGGERVGDALSQIGTKYAQSDLDAAMVMVENFEPANAEHTGKTALAGGVALHWMKSAPEEAANWWITMADADQIPRTYVDIVAEWSKNSPNQCGEWLGSQEQLPHLDQARVVFAMAISGRDPVSAKAWAETITDASLRNETLSKISE